MPADFSAGSLPVKPPPLETSLHAELHAGDMDDGQLADEHAHPVRGSRPLGLVSLMITFCCGVALTAAWYSFGGPIREAIAGMSPALAWLAPQPAAVAQPALDSAAPAPSLDQQLNAASLDLDAVRQNVDRIATSQEQIKRSIDQLSAGQDQLTKEIAKLQAVEQYILYKNSEPPAPRAPAPAPAAPPRRPAAAPMPLTPTPAPQASQAPAPR
jgi:hypothetical protein